MTEYTDIELLTGDEKIVAEARKRFEYCESYESRFRKDFVDDLKFACGDSSNGYQWPNNIRRNRDIDERPCLTINKTHQHCVQIINDAKRNKPSVTIRPTGGGATYDSSQIYEGIVRRIEYLSNAEAAYDKATEFQVYAGMGYWRVVTDYLANDSFDQEIFIRRIKNPLNVYLDPDINEVDGSDARFGFIFDDVPKDLFGSKYPKHKSIGSKAPLGGPGAWITKEHVRVAEYYRALDEEDTLVAFTDPSTGSTSILRKEEIPQPLRDMILADPTTRTRKIIERKIQWYKIAGDEIIDRKDWPGCYIPIVRVPGEEIIIDGEVDRKGHTRQLKDPQRIYNYWSSAAVEFVALQSKTPYIAPAKAIEGYETYWNNANRVNYAVLPYNNVEDDGTVIPPPKRDQPPVFAPAYIQGLQISANEMMMVSGQYQAVMGQPSNETSGKAINERQRQGENATYHFIDSQAHAIRFTGKIIIDLIPKIYDTPRIIRILAEDGEETEVQIDPSHQKAFAEEQNRITQQVTRIFNPNVGRYEVQADIGPSYGTRRQEAFNAFSQIAAQNPQLMAIIGDLVFANADFPGADEIAERIKRTISPQILGEGASPDAQAAQAQLQNLQQMVQVLLQQLAEEKRKVQMKDNKHDVEVYDAMTRRLSALEKIVMTPKLAAQLLHDFAKQEHSAQLSHDLSTHNNEMQQENLANQPTQEGANNAVPQVNT